MAGDALNPPSLHKYLYAYSSPMVYTDPWGEANTDEAIGAYIDLQEEREKRRAATVKEAPLALEDLQAPHGYFYSQYQAAKEYASDTKNPWLARQGMAFVEGLAGLVGIPEEYLGRSTLNIPYAIGSGSKRGGTTLGEGIVEGDPFKVYEGSMELYIAFTEGLAAATPASSDIRALAAPGGRAPAMLKAEDGLAGVTNPQTKLPAAKKPLPAPPEKPPNAAEVQAVSSDRQLGHLENVQVPAETSEPSLATSADSSNSLLAPDQAPGTATTDASVANGNRFKGQPGYYKDELSGRWRKVESGPPKVSTRGKVQNHHLVTEQMAEALESRGLKGYELRAQERLQYPSAPGGHVGYEDWHRAYDWHMLKFIQNEPLLTDDLLLKEIHNYYQAGEAARRIPGVNLR